MGWPKGKPFSEEHRQHLREARAGSKPNLGKTLSAAHRKALSDSSPFKGKKRDDAFRENLREKLKGHTVSEETRAKISNANRGGTRNQTGPANTSWSSDEELTYAAIHGRARKALPKTCVVCDKSPVHAALRWDTADEHLRFDNVAGYWFSIRLEDYVPLCVTHHHLYDREMLNLPD